MLERLTALPEGVDGLRARGKITKSDYENVVRPLLDDARRQGRRLQLIYHFGPDFDGMTAGAAQQDIRLGIAHLYDFGRLAVVSDVAWVRRASRMAGTIMPCPAKVFGNSQWDEAVRWVSSPPRAEHLSHRKIEQKGVVIVEPGGPLRAEEFDELGRNLDPWIMERGGKLNGVVVHTHSLPGWENFGAFLRHLRFLRDHRGKTRRLAIAANAAIARIAPHIVERFVDAEIKRFSYEELDQAIEWASGAEPPSRKIAPANGGREQSARA